MSPYIPPNQTLLTSGSPATIGTPRRMTIYFQPSPSDPNTAGPNENDPPVTPVADSNIDIAISNKKRYLQYAVDRSTNATANNPTPLSADNTAQRTYINENPDLNYSGIPNAKLVFDNSRAVTMFDGETLTRDAGVEQVDIISTEVGTIKGHYAGNVGRPFAIRKYIGELNALESSDPTSAAQINAHHNKLIDATLLKTRGVNSQHKFVIKQTDGDETADDRITLGNMFYQGDPGRFALGSYVRQDVEGLKPTHLTIESLKQVGLNILFNAVGGNDIEATIKTTGDAALAELVLAAPIGPRIGQKVKLSRFSAAREAQKLFGANPAKASDSAFFNTDDDVDSYGSFNNPLSQFDRLVSVGQIAVTATMVIAFVAVLGPLTSLIKAARGSSPETSGPLSNPDFNTDQNNLVKGSSTVKRTIEQPNEVYPTQTSSNLGNFLADWANLDQIFIKPNHRFEDCISAGILEFFGFNIGIGGLDSSAANSSMKILTESGRLGVTLRELFRNSFSDLSSNAAAAFTGTGASSPISGIFEFLKSLTELKIVKFINVLMTIGDRMLTAKESKGKQVSEGSTMVGQYSPDDYLPTRDNYIKKSRLSDGSLVWSTKTAPYFSLNLVSMSVKLRQELNLHDSNVPIGGNNPLIRDGTSRISAEQVKDWEGQLEADYMPFYFHDLRTNEIMSFHAFLENATEDFSVEYSAQEGYGRMDKVQIYKGTTRNISVDFKMIATNAESHDDMWYKINRLAMMIYPQWTQGRKLDVGNLKFIQPFSQIPGATPVIRLRLGDLFKSNYSKMAVARLFGTTTRENYNVDGSRAATPATSPATPATSPAAPVFNAHADARYVKFNDVFNGTNDFTPSTSHSTTRGRGNRRQERKLINPNDIFKTELQSIVVLNGENRTVKYMINHRYTAPIPNNRDSTGEAQTQQVIGSIEDFDGPPYVRAKYMGLASHNRIKLKIESFGDYLAPIPLRKRNNNPDYELVRVDLFKSILDRNQTGEELLRDINRRAGAQSRIEAASATPVTDLNLMRPDIFYGPNNPILKAFNSTAGKGLAGVITSFKVDYGDAKARWGTVQGTDLRAPMYVTISVTMAVIHDIPLGLDANGIMNAPIWPVGPSSNYFMRNPPETAATAQTPAAAPATGNT